MEQDYGIHEREPEMAKVQWHRMAESEGGYVRGYLSHCERWAIGRSGTQATVWKQVDAADIDIERVPFYKNDPFALVDRINGNWFVHCWDSINIGDAKYEVQREVTELDNAKAVAEFVNNNREGK